jgi:hypothetical protein
MALFDREREILADLMDLADIKESIPEIKAMLATIIKNQGVIMSGLTDAQAALAKQGTDITELLAEQNTLLTDVQEAIASGDPDAAVELLANQISANNSQIESVTAALQAGDPANATASTPPSSGTPAAS